jgi:hypothetical protein
LLVLAGCGKGKCNIPGVAGARQGTMSGLHIDAYGPRETKAGESFNRQPDGTSAAWFQLNQDLEGSLVNVHLNSVVVKGDVSGSLVTVRVPDELYASERRIAVSVDRVDGSNVASSNTVDIIVSKP